MHFNLTLPEFDGLSDKSSLQQIKGYLTVLNEQLRYMMLNIDEDNFSGSFSDSLVDISKVKEMIETLENNVKELDQKVTRLSLSLGQKEKRLLLDSNGNLLFDTGFGDTPFSLGISYSGDIGYLTAYDKDGKIIGSASLDA